MRQHPYPQPPASDGIRSPLGVRTPALIGSRLAPETVAATGFGLAGTPPPHPPPQRWARAPSTPQADGSADSSGGVPIPVCLAHRFARVHEWSSRIPLSMSRAHPFLHNAVAG